jgi:hypothetical protein
MVGGQRQKQNNNLIVKIAHDKTLGGGQRKRKHDMNSLSPTSLWDSRAGDGSDGLLLPLLMEGGPSMATTEYQFNCKNSL